MDPARWLEDHGDTLYCLAHRAVLNRAQAEDLVQDTLLQGIVKLSSFEARCSVRTWLVTILKNRIVDHVRRNNRQARLSDPRRDLESRVKHGDPDEPSALFANSELQRELKSCIDELSDIDRQMFIMSEVEGSRHADLAVRYDMSCVNVRVRLHRARLKVRDSLVAKGFRL